ncbi:MAG TPA: dockerin type I domain-containing protein, partial [Clostridia bacterium]
DCTVLKRYILSSETSINQKASDLDGDGKINSKDYALLKNYILLKIDKFPVEK